MLTKPSKLLGLAAVLLAAGVSAGAGSAAAPETAPARAVAPYAVHVRYDDLDLTTDAGLRALYARISAASRHACGDLDTRSARLSKTWRRCRDEAMANALEQLDNERFTRWIAATEAAERRPQPRVTAN